jgi:hypothetical protein
MPDPFIYDYTKQGYYLVMRDDLWKRAEAMAEAARRKLAQDRKELEAIRNAQKPLKDEVAAAK